MKNNRKVKILMIGGLLTTMWGCSTNAKTTIKTKTDKITLEYGQVLSENVLDYLDSSKSDKEALENARIELAEVKNAEGKEYPGLGEFKIYVVSGEEKHEIKVTVKDSTKPAFKEFNSKYEVAYGGALDKSLFKDVVEDLDETTVTVDDSVVNYKKAGEYKVKVSAKDKSGNEISKEIVVVVKEEKKEENKKKGRNS